MSFLSGVSTFFDDLNTISSDIHTAVAAMQAATAALTALEGLGSAVLSEANMLTKDLEATYVAYLDAKNATTAKALRASVLTVQNYVASQKATVATKAKAAVQ